MGKWLTILKTDFLTKKFIPLKISFFFMIGGMTTLFPFLTIQARSLGITGEELGIIYSLLPIVGIFAPSLAGLLADKIGNFKIFLSLSVVCSGLASLLFIAIPQARIEHDMPEHISFTLNCPLGTPEIQVNPPVTCDFRTDVDIANINVSTCTYSCGNLQNNPVLIKFMTNWCGHNEDCDVFEEVGIYNASRGIYDISADQYQLVGNEYLSQLNLLMFHNMSLPTYFHVDETETTLGVNSSFCPDFHKITELSDESSHFSAANCVMSCEVFADSQDICSNPTYTVALDPVLTITTYIVVRLVNGLTLATSFTLFEGAVVAILREHNGDLGLQRMYGNLGQIVWTPISGQLIDYFSKLHNKEDYSPAFYLYCAIKFVCAILFLFVDLEFKQPSNRVFKDFKILIVQKKVLAFLLFTTVVGTCFGFVETFLFWLLEDLGADKSLMGITVTVGAIFGIPLMMVSSHFIKTLGHVNTLSLCATIYVIRFVGYSFIQNPWWAMPFEALESFTNSLLAVVAISYAGILSDTSTVASLQGLYGGTYHGVGRGIGSLAGGIMIKRIGNSGTFQILAGICGASGVAYFLLNKFYLSKLDSEEELKKISSPESKDMKLESKNRNPESKSLNSASKNPEYGIQKS